MDYTRENAQSLQARPMREVAPDVVREAGPLGKARETVGYLNEIDIMLGDIRRKLYGPYPTEAANSAKNPNEPSLDELLRSICQRSAMVAGDLKNLLSNLE